MKFANLLMKVSRNILSLIKTVSITLDTWGKKGCSPDKFPSMHETICFLSSGSLGFVLTAGKNLKDLSDAWKWFNKDLKQAGTGNTHSKSRKGHLYSKPYLSQTVEIDAPRRINVQIHENERFRDSIADKNDTVQDLVKVNCNKVTKPDVNIP